MAGEVNRRRDEQLQNYLLRLLDRLAKPSGLIERLVGQMRELSARVSQSTSAGPQLLGTPGQQKAAAQAQQQQAASQKQPQDPAEKVLTSIDAKMGKVVSNIGKLRQRMASASKAAGGRLGAAAGGSTVSNPASQGVGSGGPGMPQTQNNPFGSLLNNWTKQQQAKGALLGGAVNKSQQAQQQQAATKSREWDPIALFARLKAKFGAAAPGLGPAMAELGRGVGTQSVSEAGAGAFSAIGSVGRMLPGKVGLLVQGFSKLGETVFRAAGAIRKWSDSLHAGNMRFAEFSASMSMVQAEQEVRDIQLSREQGERRAESARALAEARSRRERFFAPLEDAMANFSNQVAAQVEMLVPNFINNIVTAGGLLPQNDLFAAENAAVANQMPASTWMAAAGARRWTDTYGRPLRFEG